MLIEGPPATSFAPDDSLRVIRFLAAQVDGGRERMLRRYARKPKRLASRRSFLLQGLPGVGPALAARLLSQLGSVRGVMTADIDRLQQVHGVGPKKATRILELVG